MKLDIKYLRYCAPRAILITGSYEKSYAVPEIEIRGFWLNWQITDNLFVNQREYSVFLLEIYVV
jgi:hypothetical protein